MERIAIVKTGWCDYYDGDPATGNHRFIQEQGFGHEIYNMRPVNGKFYVYLPPIGESGAAPSPQGNFDDWVVVLVARKEGKGPLVVVGWYQGARFEQEYKIRPDFKGGGKGNDDPLGEDYVYTMIADSAYLIPPEERTLRLPHHVLGRAPIFYCRGNPRAAANKNREPMARFVEKTVTGKLRKKQVAAEVKSKGKKGASGGGFATQEHRKEVEARSMALVSEHYERKGFSVTDVSMYRGLGYDLEVTRKSTKRLVEVKGTAGDVEAFFITKNEHEASYCENWRLCIVTNVFDAPKIIERNGEKYRKLYRSTPIQFQCSRK
ncbi:hypothetical protein Q668_05700 [Alcanivorax sp. PN-3]|uniref:DUF3883 domain-containing protein n=1 Tax=Alloalcanivorax xenomutans TaxID=1094342 RepID=UPI0003B8B532|nr:DUF3883 domain-containing protein [Alloalcanivorax xenomutans]ERS15423.1 hypothetical protein Q668_05700 [Alcanivorax sp. PN-3]